LFFSSIAAPVIGFSSRENSLQGVSVKNGVVVHTVSVKAGQKANTFCPLRISSYEKFILRATNRQFAAARFLRQLSR
jgi:hypothetical protein